VVRATLGGLLALLFVAAHTVASSEWLHHCLHDDNASLHHLCSVKVLAHSSTDCPPPLAVRPPTTTRTDGARVPALPALPIPDGLLPPDRAPPTAV